VPSKSTHSGPTLRGRRDRPYDDTRSQSRTVLYRHFNELCCVDARELHPLSVGLPRNPVKNSSRHQPHVFAKHIDQNKLYTYSTLLVWSLYHSNFLLHVMVGAMTVPVRECTRAFHLCSSPSFLSSSLEGSQWFERETRKPTQRKRYC
jgi:hypothetical protein